MLEPRKLFAGFADWGANGGMMGAMMEMNGFRFLRLATSKSPTQPLSAEAPSTWSQTHTGGMAELMGSMEMKMHCKCAVVPDLADSSSRGLNHGGDWSWKNAKNISSFISKHFEVVLSLTWLSLCLRGRVNRAKSSRAQFLCKLCVHCALGITVGFLSIGAE